MAAWPSSAGRMGGATSVQADRLVVTTGFRPDFGFLREVRLGLDPAVEATPALAPLIDPNLHSCGTVRPHGEAELRHPEQDFWIAGMKSYGRAPTFLLATGHEQVRSIAAALAGDWTAAREVRLDLPETGVCATDRVSEATSCCAPAAAPATACCAPQPVLAAARPLLRPATRGGGHGILLRPCAGGHGGRRRPLLRLNKRRPSSGGRAGGMTGLRIADAPSAATVRRAERKPNRAKPRASGGTLVLRGRLPPPWPAVAAPGPCPRKHLHRTGPFDPVGACFSARQAAPVAADPA